MRNYFGIAVTPRQGHGKKQGVMKKSGNAHSALILKQAVSGSHCTPSMRPFQRSWEKKLTNYVGIRYECLTTLRFIIVSYYRISENKRYVVSTIPDAPKVAFASLSCAKRCNEQCKATAVYFAHAWYCSAAVKRWRGFIHANCLISTSASCHFSIRLIE